MGHQEVQHACVRLLYDPRFADRVYADADAALPELSADERSWVLAVDPRAWRIDADRGRRTLRALFDEYRASTTLALAVTGRYATLEAFFASASFHNAIRARGSLAMAYAHYLRSLRIPDPWFEDLVGLEQQLAACRRELDSAPARLADAPSGPWVARAPGVGTRTCDGATLEAINTLEQCLFQHALHPAMALCRDAPRPAALPARRPDEALHFVLHPAAGGSGLLELGRMVQQVLGALDRPTPLSAYASESPAAALGPQRAFALLRDLEGEGLVIRA